VYTPRREVPRRIQQAFGPFGSGQSMQMGIASHYIVGDNQVALLKTSRASKNGARGSNSGCPRTKCASNEIHGREERARQGRAGSSVSTSNSL
jgi:hypothetical protein